MAETNTTPPSPELVFPEQLRESRVVGTIDSADFPWLSGIEPKPLHVAELTYDEGVIYAVSAGTPKMNAITRKMSEADKHVSADGRYSRLDQFFLQACHLEVNGTAGQSRAINLLRGVEDADFEGLTIKAWHESPKPNTRRLYYGLTRLSSINMTPVNDKIAQELEPKANLFIRFGYTDKQNQLTFLHLLTGRSRQKLRNFNAGSI